MASKKQQSGVAVDSDAVRMHDPVTVVVSPLGNEYDADTWSDANNYLGMGYTIKDGYPSGPAPVDPSTAGDAPSGTVTAASPGNAAASS